MNSDITNSTDQAYTTISTNKVEVPDQKDVIIVTKPSGVKKLNFNGMGKQKIQTMRRTQVLTPQKLEQKSSERE